MQNTNDTNIDTKLSAIDKALAAAKARKAAKQTSESATAEPPPQKEPKAKKTVNTDFAKQQKKEALAAARLAAKAVRDAERQKRREEKVEASASKKPVHMKKIETAAAKLPAITASEAARLYEEITTNFSQDQVAALALHLQHFVRAKATERALGQRVMAGSKVRVVAGDARFVGKFGTVDRAQRIRCYVNIPGIKRPVYLFTSDVEVLQIQEPAVSNDSPIAAVG
jgi:hypothetical protein